MALLSAEKVAFEFESTPLRVVNRCKTMNFWASAFSCC